MVSDGSGWFAITRKGYLMELQKFFIKDNRSAGVIGRFDAV